MTREEMIRKVCEFALKTTNICCRKCGVQEAVTAWQSPMVSNRWTPYCQECDQEEHENYQDTYRHEMNTFGGSYGLPSFNARPIQGAIQNDDGCVYWDEDERTKVLEYAEKLLSEPVIEIGDVVALNDRSHEFTVMEICIKDRGEPIYRCHDKKDQYITCFADELYLVRKGSKP